MRWSYLIPRCLLLSLFWTFFTFAFDPLLQRAVVSGGQIAVGATVDVTGLSTSFFPPTMTLRNVAIANKFSPGTNLIEFDNFQVKLEGDPLLQKSFIIEKGKLTGLRWGTSRDESGTVEEDDKGLDLPGGDPFKQLGEKATGLGDKALGNLIDLAKDQLDPNKLESVRLAKQMQVDWKKRFDTLKRRSNTLKYRVEEIQKSIKVAKGNPLERIDAYAKAADEVNVILRDAQNIRGELTRLPKMARTDFESLEIAKDRDVESVQTKVKLLRLDGETLSETLLGQELAQRVSEAMMWIRFVRSQLSQVQDVEQPARWRGVDIDFTKKKRLPQFLIRSLYVSGETEIGGEQLAFKGLVSDITTEPAVLGKPTVVRLKGHGPADVSIEIVLDHTGDVPVDEMKLICLLPRRQQMSLGNEKSLAVDVSAEKTEIHVSLQLSGNNLNGNLSFLQTPVTLTARTNENTDEHLQRVMQGILSGVKYLKGNALLTGTLSKPQWKVKSNLGPAVADGLNRFVANEIETRKQQLVAQVEKAAGDQSALLGKMLNEEYGGILADLDLNETSARGLIQRVAGKNLNLGGLKKLFR